MAKAGQIKQYSVGEIIPNTEYNQMNAELGASPIIPHNETTGARDDGELGDPLSGTNGHLFTKLNLRNGATANIYNTSGSLISSVNFAGLQNNIYDINQQAILNGGFDHWWAGWHTFSGAGSEAYPVMTANEWFVDTDADGGTWPGDLHRRDMLSIDAGINSAYKLTVDGSSSSLGADSYYLLRQRIKHGVKKLCGYGKTITVSFLAKSTIANKKIGVSLDQEYGEGTNSPSPTDTVNGTNWELNSSWQSFTHTFTTTDYDLKTFSNQYDERLKIKFHLAWGTNQAAVVGTSVAEGFNTAGDVYITNVQVNAGSSALAFAQSNLTDFYIDPLPIIAWRGQHTNIPFDWAWADGSAVSRGGYKYEKAWSVLGTTGGAGDGTTTFNLVDDRGVVHRGMALGSGRDLAGDRVINNYQSDYIQRHKHSMNSKDFSPTLDTGIFGDASETTSERYIHTNNSSAVEGRFESETTMKNISVRYIVKLF